MDSVKLSLRFGITVKRTRESMGLTQTELAKAADVDQSLISRIETGARNTHFNIDKLSDIAKALKQDSLGQLIIFAESIGDKDEELMRAEKFIENPVWDQVMDQVRSQVMEKNNE